MESDKVNNNNNNNRASDIACGGLRRPPPRLERRRFEKPPNRNRWTIEEDEKLRMAVESIAGRRGKWGKVTGGNWGKIAECFEGRSIVQCQIRWAHVVHPYIVKGPWSKEEDEKLIKWVCRYGKKWRDICNTSYIPGRNRFHCEDRWFALNKKSSMDLVPQFEGMSLVSCPPSHPDEAHQNSVV